MQTSVPTIHSGTDAVGGSTVPRLCLRCNKRSENLIKLSECGHTFCHGCIVQGIQQPDSLKNKHTDEVSCLRCGTRSKKPGGTTGVLHVGSGSRFYTQDSDEVADTEQIDDRKNVCDHPLRSKSERSKPPPTSMQQWPCSRHPLADGWVSDDDIQRFDSNISTDTKECVYFGGDITSDGNLILADWFNSTVKMFAPSGEFLCYIKTEEPPVDLTVVKNDMVIVSLGSWFKKVIFLTYTKTQRRHCLNKTDEADVPGFLYSTTRFGACALGILEKHDSSILLAKVAYKKPLSKAVKEFKLKSNVSLSSESGIHYNEYNSKILLTSRRKLYCISKDGFLLFVKDFQNAKVLYQLGSITCDNQGIIYIGSDQCILKVSRDDGLLSVVQTFWDPYYIIKSQDRLFLIGKGNKVVCLYVNRFEKQ